GYLPSPKDLTRLKGIDRDRAALSEFRKTVHSLYGMDLPGKSLKYSDYLLESPEIKADIIFSNPPWVSFGDLDEKDKSNYKPVFRKSGLTPDPRSLLLGGSRIDIAALFVAIALDRDTAEDGEGYFFLPASLFRGEGAHSAFRRLKLPGGRSFALTEIRDLEGGAPFPGAGTRYCFACYKADRRQSWPVPWLKAGPGGEWTNLEAGPADGPDSPLVPHPAGSAPPPPPRIPVPAGTVPRQGVNCGGASEVFIIEEIGEENEGRLPVVNRRGKKGYLPPDMVYPLMSAASFSGKENNSPDRWIFLPYGRDGKVHTREQLETSPDALEWLERHRSLLEQRKGVMLKRYGAKGIFWALLGVGPYAFSPWKLAWESYGRNRFIPRLYSSANGSFWQGNQALHAYLPFDDKESAERAAKEFSSPNLEDYLRKLGGAGTKSWAQPGRIRRLLISDS
ncbi:MAG: hypothetical protein KAJ98_06400, partial [Spirochaetaceae bacterium]|nr:hypothetical protein [Spirochaetaceae bacterium]